MFGCGRPHGDPKPPERTLPATFPSPHPSMAGPTARTRTYASCRLAFARLYKGLTWSGLVENASSLTRIHELPPALLSLASLALVLLLAAETMEAYAAMASPQT